MKKEKIIYWTATTIFTLFECVMPALNSQTEMAKKGIRHLGYLEYFNLKIVNNIKNDYFCLNFYKKY